MEIESRRLMWRIFQLSNFQPLRSSSLILAIVWAFFSHDPLQVSQAASRFCSISENVLCLCPIVYTKSSLSHKLKKWSLWETGIRSKVGHVWICTLGLEGTLFWLFITLSPSLFHLKRSLFLVAQYTHSSALVTFHFNTMTHSLFLLFHCPFTSDFLFL